MKIKKIITFFFVAMGLLGSVLLFFGWQFNGTMSDEILLLGIAGIGIFALWGISNIVGSYLKDRELENMQ